MKEPFERGEGLRDARSRPDDGVLAKDMDAVVRDGGHVGRFIGDAFEAGAISIEELTARTGLAAEAIEALVSQGEPLAREAAGG